MDDSTHTHLAIEQIYILIQFDFAVQEGSNDGSGQYVFPARLENCGKYPIVELTQKESFLARDYLSDYMR